MKVLCIHGVGHAEANLDWQTAWKAAVAQGLGNADHEALEVRFTAYDDLFAPVVSKLSATDVLRAVALLGGGVLHRELALPAIGDQARWTAGMVIAWVDYDDLREEACERFAQDLASFQPELVCAHSLGSLISYDALRRDPSQSKGLTYLTFGSQLGNLFVRGQFAGRIEPLADAAFWYHLYNPHDHVFTAPLNFGPFETADNFTQVVTPFGNDLPWPLNHDAVSPSPDVPDDGYLTHHITRAEVWPRIAAPALAAPRTMALKRMATAVAKTPDSPKRRALLVGINEYPDPANRLEGCLNDVFTMSAILQESGFGAEDIRVVFDNRASADGIMERLHWLLDGTGPGTERFFFYSGHGAQLPVYGVNGTIERIDACLVPYDFAWSRESAITDDRLVNLYSQLPYDAHFMMVLDSCYSGGMTRGDARIRGLDPPDDIRHRMLQWDPKLQMWVPRKLPRANPDLDPHTEKGRQYVGSSGATQLLGRAVSLRTLPCKEYDQVRKDLKHEGPYLPIVYEACGEKEFASEYRHGVTSYGAFTYALIATLRRHKDSARAPTFAALLKETGDVLEDLKYQQHPVVVGPRVWLQRPVPWMGYTLPSNNRHGKGPHSKRVTHHPAKRGRK
jgi:hypothetical protein